MAALVSVGTLNEENMDAVFVKAVSANSDPGGLKVLEVDHRFSDSIPLGRHWAYRCRLARGVPDQLCYQVDQRHHLLALNFVMLEVRLMGIIASS